MADEPSDPKIVDRLKNLPPFDEEKAPDIAPQTIEEVPDEPAPQPEPVEEPKEEVKEEEKPVEEVKDRTKEQFEKLKEHNAALKGELEATKRKNALESLYPEPPTAPQPPTTNVLPTPQQFPNMSPKEIKDVFSSLVDANGYVDSGLLIETLKETDQRAKAAEERAKLAEEENKKNARRMDDFERKEVMKLVHERFPKLNPDNVAATDETSKFDENFYDMFQGEIMRQWTSVGQADPMQVAEKVSGILYPVKKADKEKMEEAEKAKKDINATTVRPASTISTYKDKEDLIQATRKGSHGALMERLKNIGQ